eukprot:TRINITY_DN1401_c0_g1_i3.p1 TRINITY_DN1401_c0_g1~~TRINITY_DN1401_c0_g1_i3.p1  ORF type:complete len:287 (+),score=82.53 TRINITY_DN1401_c0_g1_i3:296-1156(+)
MDEPNPYISHSVSVSRGYEYTSKLQRMFTDVSISTDLNEAFQSSNSQDMGADFHALVLTTGSWPFSVPKTNFIPPLDLKYSCDIFEEFYTKQHQGRQLQWIHTFSRADIRPLFTKRKHEWNVTVFQGAVLLLFEDSDQLSCQDVSTLLDVSNQESKQLIDSLMSNKVLIENKDDSGNQVYELNLAFSHRKRQVKLSSVFHQETAKENEHMHKTIVEERRLQVQAAIVRIMKARKTLDHQQLMTETFEQLKRFTASVSMVKKCIEQLIEKGYLERDTKKRDRYSYVA